MFGFGGVVGVVRSPEAVIPQPSGHVVHGYIVNTSPRSVFIRYLASVGTIWSAPVSEDPSVISQRRRQLLSETGIEPPIMRGAHCQSIPPVAVCCKLVASWESS